MLQLAYPGEFPASTRLPIKVSSFSSSTKEGILTQFANQRSFLFQFKHKGRLSHLVRLPRKASPNSLINESSLYRLAEKRKGSLFHFGSNDGSLPQLVYPFQLTSKEGSLFKSASREGSCFRSHLRRTTFKRSFLRRTACFISYNFLL